MHQFTFDLVVHDINTKKMGPSSSSSDTSKEIDIGGKQCEECYIINDFIVLVVWQTMRSVSLYPIDLYIHARGTNAILQISILTQQQGHSFVFTIGFGIFGAR